MKCFNTGLYLTRREKEVVAQLLRGYSAKESAKVLGISYRTVETHIDNIKNKFGVNRKHELIVKLYAMGELKPIILSSIQQFVDHYA